MQIQTLRLLSFRAHSQTEVSFAPKVNLIYGPNGAGKTNLLEAIHYLCLTKSFITAQDAYAVRRGAPYFEVEGVFEGRRRPEVRVKLVYVPEEGKRVFVNRAPLERLAQIVGQLPVVVFAPQDQALTAEGPDVRRRYLNNIISQARPVYLDDLLKYRRALKQRNELLFQARRGKAGSGFPAQLASWSAELVALGTRVVLARHRFLLEFRKYLEQAYEQLEAVSERPGFTYQTIGSLPDTVGEEGIAERFQAKLDRVARRERERGRTLIGPHLDEMVFFLDDLEVRRYASQGQHRTFGMALKLAQFFYLQEQLDETPLLLLDDIFGSLDPARSSAFLELLMSDVVGQSLITAAHRDPFNQKVNLEASPNRALLVEEGVLGARAGTQW